MPKFLRFALAILLVTALLLGLAIVLLPSDYEVRREVTIEAEAAAIHAYVEQLTRWPEWCPWNVATYPSLVNTFAGPERGVDSTWTWDMDEGPGSLVITASDPAKGVWFDLSFGEVGRELHSKGVIQYFPAGGSTRVAWTNRGELSGFAKLMGPMLDAMMGKDFEAGLAKLKQVVEAGES